MGKWIPIVVSIFLRVNFETLPHCQLSMGMMHAFVAASLGFESIGFAALGNKFIGKARNQSGTSVSNLVRMSLRHSALNS